MDCDLWIYFCRRNNLCCHEYSNFYPKHKWYKQNPKVLN